MKQQLTDMSIDKVALVPKGANGRTFAVLKQDGDPVPPPASLADLWKAADAADPAVARRGVLAKLADWLGLATEPVVKAQTFATIVAGRQLTDALYDSWYTLEDALWSAMWAVDANGADLSIEAKQALVAQNLDEFKAWLLGQMDEAASIAKSDRGTRPERALDALLRKAGGDDGDRTTVLAKAAEPLRAALGDVGSPDPVEKRAQPEEEAMTGEELALIQKSIADAVAPIAADVAELKKAAASPAPVAKTDPDPEDGLTLESVAKAVDSLADRFNEYLSERGVRKSADGQTGAPVAKSGDWAKGIL
jgi:hypothetical protein